MHRVLISLLLTVLLILQYQLWFGKNNVFTLLETRKKMQEQHQENTKLYAKNRMLMKEISELKTGTYLIEEQARKNLGMIKSGETFYFFYK